MKKALLISLTDQIILSGANFLLGIFLIKTTSKSDYGLFVLANTVILFITGLHAATITTQMTILAPHKGIAERNRFCSALYGAQMLIYLPACSLFLIILQLTRSLSLIGPEMQHVCTAIALSTGGIILKEFVRSYLFIITRPDLVLAIDSIYVIVSLACIAASYFTGLDNLAIASLYCIGLASLLASIPPILNKQTRHIPSLGDMLLALRESWRHGKWAVSGIILSLIQGQSYVYLLSAIGGTSRTADANAARLFFTPLSWLHMSASRVLIPKWAAMRAHGQMRSVITMVKKIQIFLILVVAGYMLLIFLFKDLLISGILTKSYSNIGPYFLLWGVLSIVQTARSSDSWILQVLHRFRNLAYSGVCSTIMAIAGGAFLINHYGPEFSVLALILAEIILLLFLRSAYKDATKEFAY